MRSNFAGCRPFIRARWKRGTSRGMLLILRFAHGPAVALKLLGVTFLAFATYVSNSSINPVAYLSSQASIFSRSPTALLASQLTMWHCCFAGVTTSPNGA